MFVRLKVLEVFEDLTNKYSAYKKVVSRIANSRVRRIKYKCGLQKGYKQIIITNE